MGTGSLSRGQSGQGRALTTHFHLSSRLKKEYSYTSTPRLGFRGLFHGELYLWSEILEELKHLEVLRIDGMIFEVCGFAMKFFGAGR
jgi:hypothetical protein